MPRRDLILVAGYGDEAGDMDFLSFFLSFFLMPRRELILVAGYGDEARGNGFLLSFFLSFFLSD
jgi:hypothetical protein